MSNDSSVRIEVDLAGQKMILTTTAENEQKLRNAATLVDEQIAQITSGPNRSIERAALMTAVKLAAEVQDLQNRVPQSNSQAASNELIDALATKLSAIEKQVDMALDSLSLPGSPRSIVP